MTTIFGNNYTNMFPELPLENEYEFINNYFAKNITFQQCQVIVEITIVLNSFI